MPWSGESVELRKPVSTHYGDMDRLPHAGWTVGARTAQVGPRCTSAGFEITGHLPGELPTGCLRRVNRIDAVHDESDKPDPVVTRKHLFLRIGVSCTPQVA